MCISGKLLGKTLLLFDENLSVTSVNFTSGQLPLVNLHSYSNLSQKQYLLSSQTYTNWVRTSGACLQPLQTTVYVETTHPYIHSLGEYVRYVRLDEPSLDLASSISDRWCAFLDNAEFVSSDLVPK